MVVNKGGDARSKVESVTGKAKCCLTMRASLPFKQLIPHRKQREKARPHLFAHRALQAPRYQKGRGKHDRKGMIESVVKSCCEFY